MSRPARGRFAGTPPPRRGGKPYEPYTRASWDALVAAFRHYGPNDIRTVVRGLGIEPASAEEAYTHGWPQPFGVTPIRELLAMEGSPRAEARINSTDSPIHARDRKDLEQLLAASKRNTNEMCILVTHVIDAGKRIARHLVSTVRNLDSPDKKIQDEAREALGLKGDPAKTAKIMKDLISVVAASNNSVIAVLSMEKHLADPKNGASTEEEMSEEEAVEVLNGAARTIDAYNRAHENWGVMPTVHPGGEPPPSGNDTAPAGADATATAQEGPVSASSAQEATQGGSSGRDGGQGPF